MHNLFIYLLMMVIVVPLSKRLGFGSVIGYLVAGALIGPQGFSLLYVQDGTSEVAEFGVIMMLLLIGLELNPKLLWKMRGPILGLGSLQMIGSIFIFASFLLVMGMAGISSWAIGMIVAVSSTAIALQTLQEQGYLKSRAGERAFAVLLFQDIAVIPILALFSFLSPEETDANSAARSPLLKVLLILGAVLLVVAVGRFLIRPLFKLISRTHLRETFTALALLIVVSAAELMSFVGLSPALGAFLAGVVLADSEFKHQIEADIEPFKGLLLGLFFITIGSSIQFNLIRDQPLEVLLWVVGIVAVKSILNYGIARFSRMAPPESLLFAISLGNGGEFAFVLIGQAHELIPAQTAQLLTASIALSMAIAPLLIKLTIQKGMSRLDCVKAEERLPDTIDESEKDNPVLVIGIGRFGQTLVRFLRAYGYASTVLDIDSEQIDVIAKFGIKSYFGDGSNLDLLRAAGLENVKALVIAIDEPEITVKIAEMVTQVRPELPIFVRAYDRLHAYRLLNLGVSEVGIETSGSALLLGAELLKVFGVDADRAMDKARLFYVNNQRSIRDLSAQFHAVDTEAFIQASRQASEQLEAMLRTDPEELTRGAASEWPRENV